MRTKIVVISVVVLLITFLVWANWPKKKVINPAWQMDFDAAVKAGHSEKEAIAMADKAYPKYVYS